MIAHIVFGSFIYLLQPFQVKILGNYWNPFITVAANPQQRIKGLVPTNDRLFVRHAYCKKAVSCLSSSAASVTPLKTLLYAKHINNNIEEEKPQNGALQ